MSVFGFAWRIRVFRVRNQSSSRSQDFFGEARPSSSRLSTPRVPVRFPTTTNSTNRMGRRPPGRRCHFCRKSLVKNIKKLPPIGEETEAEVQHFENGTGSGNGDSSAVVVAAAPEIQPQPGPSGIANLSLMNHDNIEAQFQAILEALAVAEDDAEKEAAADKEDEGGHVGSRQEK